MSTGIVNKFVNYILSPFMAVSIACTLVLQSMLSLASEHAIDELLLTENDETITLYANGDCRVNGNEALSLPEDISLTWDSLISKPYIEKLSGLAILEQVKQQVQRTRIVMDVNTSEQTELTIKHSHKTKKISLYSVAMMHQTYPEAKLLTDFVELLTEIRNIGASCKSLTP